VIEDVVVKKTSRLLSRLLMSFLSLPADRVDESGRHLQSSVESVSKLVDVDALESLVLISEVTSCHRVCRVRSKRK